MDKKNIPNTRNSDSKMPSFDFGKFTAFMTMLTTLFTTTPAFSQTENTIPLDLKNKNTIELSENNDSLQHQKILNEFCESVIATYGIEPWIDTIRKHMLIEINNIRKAHWLNALKENLILDKIAQKHAIYIFTTKYSHTDNKGKTPQDRMKEAWFTWSNSCENMDKWFSTLKSTLEKRMEHKPHADNILNPLITDIWIGFYWWNKTQDNITQWYNCFVMDAGRNK